MNKKLFIILILAITKLTVCFYVDESKNWPSKFLKKII